jgi:outer membrane protein TolC
VRFIGLDVHKKKIAVATTLVGVAMANRLPVISLTADLGSSPANLANLLAALGQALRR